MLLLLFSGRICFPRFLLSEGSAKDAGFSTTSVSDATARTCEVHVVGRESGGGGGQTAWGQRAGLWPTGWPLLGPGEAELLHLPLQGRTLHAQAGGGAVRAAHHPVGF